MFERVLAIIGALWIANKLEEGQTKKEAAENLSCGCGCLCFIGLWILGMLLLKACSG